MDRKSSGSEDADLTEQKSLKGPRDFESEEEEDDEEVEEEEEDEIESEEEEEEDEVESEEEEEDEVESDEEDDKEEEDDEVDFSSPIISLIDFYEMLKLSSVLESDSEFMKLCHNILKSLQKEDFCDADAHDFSETVNRVLEHTFFLEELYRVSEDYFFLVPIRYYAVLTQRRVETIKDRVSRIKNDKYFRKATKGGKPKMIIRGCLSIILGYCISEDDLKKMSRRIGKVPPEIWGDINYVHNEN